MSVVKLSKGNLFLWSRIFPTLIIVADAILGFTITYIAFLSKLYFLLLVWVILVCGHFFWKKVLRYYKVNDAYLYPELKQICFEGLNANKIVITFAEINDVEYVLGIIELRTIDDRLIFFVADNREVINYFP